MNNHEYNGIIKDYETLGIPSPLAKKLADVHLKEKTKPYYERSRQDNELFEEAHKIMAMKSVLPITTPFITI
ncbi:hypothetical protein [Sphaerospermopsis kisseleviana]|uniref:hypothetical protein n=1 Tax=Sphaerospermopsis kisseleviana TaxID=289435 RepID=UPI000B6084CC|nr:hypothetical protein [Sphaerospermopsis kisseleviana]BAZ81069.1 hypothetical protein NIES73_23350 [Sphaerospermopsis kisseleviana NIES-73]